MKSTISAPLVLMALVGSACGDSATQPIQSNQVAFVREPRFFWKFPLKEWQALSGKKSSEVIRKVGYPTRRIKDIDGSECWSYGRNHYVVVKNGVAISADVERQTGVREGEELPSPPSAGDR